MPDNRLHSRRIAIGVMLATPLFLSSNLVFGRMVIPEVSPFILAFLRWSAVSLVMLPFMAGNFGSLARLAGQQWPRLLALGFLGMFICGGVVYAALRHTTATNSTLIYTTSPVFIMLLDAAVNRKRIGLREALGSVIAFAGVAVIVLKGDLSVLASLDFNIGDLMILLASLSWAGYAVFGRHPALKAVANLQQFALLAFFGALVLAPAALAEIQSGGMLPSSTRAWMGLAGIVLFGSLASFLGFQYGVRVLGPTLAGHFTYLMSPYGVVLAILLLGETFEAFHAAGIALVMAGVILATFRSGGKSEKLVVSREGIEPSTT